MFKRFVFESNLIRKLQTNYEQKILKINDALKRYELKKDVKIEFFGFGLSKITIDGTKMRK